MKISYRIDDVSNYMSNDNFLKIELLFKKYNIKPLIGVIPNNEDKKLIKFGEVEFDFWKKIRKLQKTGWTVAMHGSNHVYETKESGILKYPKKSEFSGLSIYKQRKKIKEGIKIFNSESVYSNIFMAPSHSFDNITIKILEAEGFKYITDGLFICNFKLNDFNIQFIPQVSSKIIPVFFNTQTICLHPNNWSSEDFLILEKEIIKYRKHIVDFENLLYMKPKKFNKFLSSIILHIKTKGKRLI